jgi:hypothetical protein
MYLEGQQEDISNECHPSSRSLYTKSMIYNITFNSINLFPSEEELLFIIRIDENVRYPGIYFFSCRFSSEVVLPHNRVSGLFTTF